MNVPVESKDDLLRRAAQSEETLAYLREYYRHSPVEDLLGRDPEEVAGVALAHRALAADRPQGRAKVRAFTPTRAEDGWETGTSVVQVVTDDMAFLVDSVTMEMNREQLGASWLVHPVMRVRRDVAGAIRGVCGEGSGGVELEESWIHIELDTKVDDFGSIEKDLQRVLHDVRAVVEDEPKLRARALDLAAELPDTGGDDDAEAGDLLRWLVEGHFTFFGYREYRLEELADGDILRPVPGTGLGILRSDHVNSTSFAALPPEVRAKAREPELLIITKANSRATVHQPKFLDYMGLKRFDENGQVIGERRFLGLFNHAAHAASVTQVPVLRRRLKRVLAEAGLVADSHDGKELIEILETYPRDELFQTRVRDLLPIALGVQRLRERRQLKLFVRPDVYGRYMSCIVFLPRDRYTTAARLRIQDALLEAYGGSSTDYSAMVGESALARLHVVVRGLSRSGVDVADLEARLAAAIRSWDEDLGEALRARFGEADAVVRLYAGAFPEGYKADFGATAAIGDIVALEGLHTPGDVAIDLYRPAGADERVRRFKIYRLGSPISLSHVLPLLQNMGVEVTDERPYEVVRVDGRRSWIYDLGLRCDVPDGVEAKRLFEDAFLALWQGGTENDGLNALVLKAGLGWRQVMVLRAYMRYYRQTGTTFSASYITGVLLDNCRLARMLVRLFESRMSPQLVSGEDERSAAICEEIEGSLDAVASLDSDRILRAFYSMITATLRTSFFLDGRDYLSLKFDPAGIPEVPLPRPNYEIFVYAPRFEGVHLRFGSVARGGLRWSDRREDFRTEILGLAKAQAVKNTVIVPAGSKGGFVCKRLPDPGDREAFQAEGIACYRQFISALLDITDNLVDGQVVPPPDVVRHDGDDPYLVVAADKGTATFSDIANEVAASYDFWLGDAFASGGSVGYDHKAMGITARGAWESVKYSFRELGLDVATEDFTVVGVGDMSGDVFGNGMLLSEHIKLVAAFDHRHIFLDPDPDPAASFAERRRMFALPRSSWADYDTGLVSAGGGIYPRAAKSIQLTPRVRAALGTDAVSLTPDELIHAIVRAPVDLLWNGGIGTYVKASTQSNADVGDKANDGLRADASELRCRVVGEGGNLGLTQPARIEFAAGGGLVNTDFIDNSAGVDTSDHEVNIKILLDQAVRDGAMAHADRNSLFLAMTDEVGGLVTADNYRQNVVLAASRAQAKSMLHIHARYIIKLERDKRLNRRLEYLPGDKTLAERRQAGQGLTGPEFAVLLAYTKLWLEDELKSSELPDDPYLENWLVTYFPTPLRERFADRMDAHPLRREIIATAVTNDLVNNSGTTFVFRMAEETGASVEEIARAYLVARDVFVMPSFWASVQKLDHQVDVATQLAMLLEARKLTERGARWLLHNRRPPFDIQTTIDFFADGARTLAPELSKLLAGLDRESYEERRNDFAERGVPAELAEHVALMVPAYSAFDLVEISHQTEIPVDVVAEVYFDLADRLQLSRLRERIIRLPRDDRWRSMARSALRDDLYTAHAGLTRDVLLSSKPGASPEERLAEWAEENAAAVRRADQTLREIWGSDSFDIATLSVALRAIRTLVASSTLPAS